MTQQINLYHDGLRAQRERWRAQHGLWAVGATLLAGWLLASALDAASARRSAEALRVEQAVLAAREQIKTTSDAVAAPAAEAELARLRALDAGQRRVQATLQSQVAGRAEGYTPYLLALSRQAHPSLWITGFGVSADGNALEIDGRMTDVSVLPDYLRRLTAEPQFKGRSFAQLKLKAADAQGGGSFTEFALRSQPEAAR